MMPVQEMSDQPTPVPNEDLTGIIANHLGQTVGELWIDGWNEIDDGLDSSLSTHIYDDETWMRLPRDIVHSMFETHRRTRMGGIPYWTGNGPPGQPEPGYKFLFQLDVFEFNGIAPDPNEAGGVVVVTEYEGKGSSLRIVRQDLREPDSESRKFFAMEH